MNFYFTGILLLLFGPVLVFAQDNVAEGAGSQSGIVTGARLVMATAYQSCDSLKLPPLNKKTEEVEGIKIDGKHPNGIGDRFYINDLSKVLKTHYYWKQAFRENENCHDQRARPLIYDYGGKPSITNEGSQKIDLFKNAGSGTSVLGIDCSGFVFSALAVSGRKISSHERWSFDLINKYGAKSYKEPEKNGMDCFHSVEPEKESALKPGDIIASSYHVAIVDSVESDPFNFSRMLDVKECDTLGLDDFRFTLIHSAPYKNGIGIHRVRASAYIAENFFFALGLAAYAKDACRKWFLSSQAKGIFDGFSFANVIRHNETVECVSEPRALQGQDCVQSCLQF